MQALANLVAIIHIAYFLFIVGGFLSIVIGAKKGWPWIYNPWFRIGHLLAVWIVLAEDVFRVSCPLNDLETNLRAPAPSVAESTPAAENLLDQLLHHTIPGWILDDMYWILGALLLALMFLVRPRFFRSEAKPVKYDKVKSA